VPKDIKIKPVGYRTGLIMGGIPPEEPPDWYWFDPVSELQKRFDVNDPMYGYIQAWLMPTTDIQLVDLNLWCLQSPPDNSPLTVEDFQTGSHVNKLISFAMCWAAFEHCPGGEFSGPGGG
jgi:hypothetical protein